MTPRSCEGAAVHGCIGAAVVLGGPWVSLLTEHEGTPTSTASPCVIVRGVGIGMQSFRAWEQVSPLWHPCWEGVGLDFSVLVSLGGMHVGRRDSARVCVEIVGVGRAHAEVRVWAKVL